MRRLYWRPAGPSGRALLLVAALALGLLALVESFPVQTEQQGRTVKLEAARTAARAFEVIRQQKQDRGIALPKDADPAGTGMIGAPATEITTSSGSLTSKRTAANPNFAAVVVEMLQRLDVKRGDTIAVGFSGSFPALNIAVLSAAQAMGIEPLVIASATSSDWGASDPEFMWLDMERELRSAGVLDAKALAASLGGIDDQGIGLSETGHHLVKQGIARSGIPFLAVDDYSESLDRRMEIYDEAAGGKKIRAYVNVGGGAVSVGRSRRSASFEPGINRPGPEAPGHSIMGRFLQRGVPVVHLVYIKDLALKYGLPVDPRTTPQVGSGGVFQITEPNRLLASLSLLALGGALFFVGRRARRRAHLQTLPEGEIVDSRAPEAMRR